MFPLVLDKWNSYSLKSHGFMYFQENNFDNLKTIMNYFVFCQ